MPREETRVRWPYSEESMRFFREAYDRREPLTLEYSRKAPERMKAIRHGITDHKICSY